MSEQSHGKCEDCGTTDDLAVFPGGTWCKSCLSKNDAQNEWGCAAAFWLNHNEIKSPEHIHNFHLLVKTLIDEAWDSSYPEKALYFINMGEFSPNNSRLMEAVHHIDIDHGYRIGFPFWLDPNDYDLIPGVFAAGPPVFKLPEPPYITS